MSKVYYVAECFIDEEQIIYVFHHHTKEDVDNVILQRKQLWETKGKSFRYSLEERYTT